MNLRQNETARRLMMIATVIVTLIYLWHRGAYTLNLEGWYATAASVGLLAAEVYGSFLMMLYFFSVWKIVDPDPASAPANKTVDVYIPTYNEDPELLRGTIAAALALDYPHETYVLDDGKRPEVRELCERMGARYLDRPDNRHAKAGNLNHAMTKTDGEFIVIFDADHIAQRHFITRLLGYFQDSRLAFIQTPHAFYNFDNFQGTLDYSRGVYWEEGQLFYNVIQPGKNHWNAVSFCGSAAMFRRSALEDVGGVATETITEDMQTGIRLHGRGWKSLFVNERLVSGQAATDVTSFNTQRLRWGEGNLSIFAHDNPITMPGLTIAQRLCYLGAMLSWTTGVQKLMLYAAPVAMLLTGVSPVREFSATLGVITAVYLATVWTTVKVVSNGYEHLLGTELTHMASFWTQIKATYRALFKRRFARFVVTSKRGPQSNRLINHILPQIVLIVASAGAVAVACSRWWYGLTTDVVAILIGGGLIAFHAWFAWVVMRRAMRSQDQRTSWRHPAAVHVGWRSADSDGAERGGQGVTFDLNENGAGMFLFEDPGADRLILTFSAGGRSIEVEAEVQSCRAVLDADQSDQQEAQAWRLGIKYRNPSEHALAGLWWMAATYSVSRFYDRFQYTSGHAGAGSVQRAIASQFARVPERQLPITLYAPKHSKPWTIITERVNHQRIAVVVGEPLPAGERLRFELSTPGGRLTGFVVAGNPTTVRLGSESYAVQELRIGAIGERWRERIKRMTDAPSGSPLNEVIRFSPDESKLPSMNSGSTIGAGSLAAAILAVMINGWWLADEVLVTRVLSQADATPQQRAAMDKIAERMADNQVVDEAFALRLREAFRLIDYDPGVRRMDDLICRAEFDSFYGRLTRVQILDQRGEHEAAGMIIDAMISNRTLITDPERSEHLSITAARNYLHRKKYSLARSLFSELATEYPDNSEYRVAYATVLVGVGEPDAAWRLLDGAAVDDEEWAALASVLSSEGFYSEAADIYLHLCSKQGFVGALLEKATANLMAGRRFKIAAKLLDRRLSEDVYQSGEEARLRLTLAQARLWSGAADSAIDVLQPVVQLETADNQPLLTYLQAVGASENPPPACRAVVERIYAAREAYRHSDATLQALVDAMMRIGRVAEAAPLIAQLVEKNPESTYAQLYFADALRRLGEHTEAAAHYNRVLQSIEASRAEQTVSAYVAPSPATDNNREEIVSDGGDGV